MLEPNLCRAYASKELAFQKKMLAKYPFAVKHVFRFRVSATDRSYFFIFLSTLLSVFPQILLVANTTKGPISLSQSLLLPQHKTTQTTDLSFRSHCDLSIERVCLGANMADSNRRQGKSHVSENQELIRLLNVKARKPIKTLLMVAFFLFKTSGVLRHIRKVVRSSIQVACS